MPASLSLMRLVAISQELLLMGWRGVQPKRLGMLALDLLRAREAASRIAKGGPGSDARARARHALAFVEKLEEQVLRLDAAHRAHRGLGVLGGLGHGPPRR